MFDLDKWQEVFSTLRRNPLRTFMTAFGVFWGIFMLVVLLATGTSLESGAKNNLMGRGSNQVFIWGGRTTLPFQGLKPGRHISYTTDDIPALREVPGIQHLAPRIQLGGYRGGDQVTRGSKSGAFSVMGDYPTWAQIMHFELPEGRFINPLDIAERRKVAVIGEQVYSVLFQPGESVVGATIKIRGVYFEVIGRVQSPASGNRGDRDAQTIYVPFTTFQQAFNTGNRVAWFAMTGEDGISALDLERRAKTLLSQRHKIHPEDDQAMRGYNAAEEYEKVDSLFRGIRMFMWFVGLATLFAGVLGVSNIMLIVVRERTKEIGVRKALGASPWSIISLVLQESITLTSLAGYVGLVSAVAATEAMGTLIATSDTPLGPPEIDIGVAVTATIVLIFSGAIAGFIPARQAAAVDPVKALRAE